MDLENVPQRYVSIHHQPLLSPTTAVTFGLKNERKVLNYASVECSNGRGVMYFCPNLIDLYFLLTAALL